MKERDARELYMVLTTCTMV